MSFHFVTENNSKGIHYTASDTDTLEYVLLFSKDLWRVLDVYWMKEIEAFASLKAAEYFILSRALEMRAIQLRELDAIDEANRTAWGWAR